MDTIQKLDLEKYILRKEVLPATLRGLGSQWYCGD